MVFRVNGLFRVTQMILMCDTDEFSKNRNRGVMMQPQKSRRKSESGVSEIIGAVMLISVVVMGVAIIGVVLTSQPPPEKIPALDAVISWDGIDTIYIAHNGGDSLRNGEFYVRVDNEVKPFLKTNEPGNPAWTTWSAGESLAYKLVSPDPTPPRLVQVIYKGTGSSGVMLASTNFGTGGSPSGMPTQVPTVIPPPGGSPVITGITPNSGTNGTTVIITSLAGAGFRNGATVRLTRAGEPDIPGTSVFFISSGQLSCTFNLNTLATGSWNVIVTNPDGKYSNSYLFTVKPPAPAPTVTGITPNYGNSSTVVTVTNLAGTGFQPGAAVKLTSGSHPDITATTVNYVSPTQLTCVFDLAVASSGVRNVIVTNPDGKSGSLVNGFEVMPPLAAPTVTAITPATGSAGSLVKITSLQGTGFVTGASVKLNMTGYDDIVAADVLVINPTLITCNITLPAGAIPWQRNVVVTNIDGKNGMLSSGFTITGVAPTPTGMTPSSGSAGSTIYNVNIAGTGFSSGAAVKLNRTSVSGIDATNVVVSSPTLITCDLSIPAGTASGQWNVSVSNTDGKSGILVNGFTVGSSLVTVTGISPASGNQGTTLSSVSIGGSGFVSGATVKLNRTGYTDVPATGMIVGSSNLITCSISIPAGTTFGFWNVVVTNPDGSNGMLSNAFRVTTPVPTVTARSNATIYRGWPGYELITGTNFVNGATSVINTTTGNSIPSTSCTYRSATQLFCSYDLLGSTVNTQYRVAVINPDGQSAIMNPPTSNYVSVASPAPTLPSTPAFSPATGIRDTTGITITAPGTYLQPGMAVVLTSATTPTTTITAYNVNVVSPTSVIFTIDIPTGARAGAYAARYTNTDGQTVTRTARFTVQNPTVTAITPATGRRGTTVPITAITGTGFQPGVTQVRFTTNTGTTNQILLTNINVVSSTRISGTLVIPAGQTVGTYYVRVTNADATTGISGSGIFSITT
jgi:hypothetical protein